MVVGQLEVEDLEDALLKTRIVDGGHQLDAAVEIAGHEVGTRDVNRIAVFEPIDARVFEVFPDDGGDGDGLAHAGDTGAQGADPTDDQLDPHASLRSAIEGTDDGGIDEGIGFEDEVAFLTVFGFFVNEFKEFGLDLGGGHVEVLELGVGRKAGEEVEKPCRILVEIFPVGEVAHVGVDLGGAGVVVAGRQMEVAFERAPFALDHLGDLGVDFETGDAVHDMGSHVFEGFGPTEIVFFVEAGFELHEDGDLFAIPDGVDEGFDDGGFGADTVEGHPDCQRVGIDGGFLDELDHRLKTFVRVIEEDLLPIDRTEDVFGIERRERFGRVGGREQVGERFVSDDLPEGSEVERDGVVVVDVFLFEMDVAVEKSDEIFVGIGVEFQPDDGTLVAGAKPLFEDLEEIIGFLLLDLHVGIAGDAEGGGGTLGVAGEEISDEVLHDALDGDKRLARLDEAREHSRDPHQAVLDVALFVGELDHDPEAEIVQVGKGMGGIDGDGDDEWVYVLEKCLRKYFLFLIRELLIWGDANLMTAQIDKDLPKRPLEGLHLAVELGVDRFELFGRRHFVRSSLLNAGFVEGFEPGDPDHGKLVEIGSVDGDKFEPLKRRQLRILRLSKHPGVELQPAELAVEIILRV